MAGIGGILWQSRIANLERRRAEARSADLRELSNSLLSELDDALKEIPGSTGAQKLLVTRVLEHLDHMANDAAGDRQTTLDLIEAYTRLGNVQGNLYYQNLADTSGAVASFDKALALAAPLAKTYPSDKDVLRAQAAAFEARGEALSQANQAQASVASLRSAVAIYDRVTQLPGMTPALIFEAAIAYETLGNELAEDFGLADPAGGAAAYHRAIDMDEQALRLNPNFMPVRRGLPVMHLHLGNLLLETEPTASLQEVKLALSLQAALPPDQRGRLNQLRVHAVLLRKQAVAYGELGQYALADPLFAESLSSSQHFVDADAKDASALADLQRDLDDAAVSYESAANPLLGASPRDRNANLATAEQLLVREIETIRQDMKLSSTTDDDKPLLASVQIHLDAIRSALHHAIRSPAETSLSLAVLRHLADDPHATAGDIDLAVQADLIAQPASLRDPAHDVVLAERGVALTRRREATYFLLLARACRANHQPGQAAAREGLSLLPPFQVPLQNLVSRYSCKMPPRDAQKASETGINRPKHVLTTVKNHGANCSTWNNFAHLAAKSPTKNSPPPQNPTVYPFLMSQTSNSATSYRIGVMQGRLSAPEDGRFQSFPRESWRQEIARARQAGFEYIEWIHDEYGRTANPIFSEAGLAEMDALKAKYGVETPALCGDWFMDFPLVRCSAEELQERERHLHELIPVAKRIGAGKIVMPFVDQSRMATEEEKVSVQGVLMRALPVAEEFGVELHLEADFGPSEFAGVPGDGGTSDAEGELGLGELFRAGVCGDGRVCRLWGQDWFGTYKGSLPEARGRNRDTATGTGVGGL